MFERMRALVLVTMKSSVFSQLALSIRGEGARTAGDLPIIMGINDEKCKEEEVGR